MAPFLSKGTMRSSRKHQVSVLFIENTNEVLNLACDYE